MRREIQCIGRHTDIMQLVDLRCHVRAIDSALAYNG